MILLVAGALAHVPHAVLAGVAIGDPGAPWWALYHGGESSVLYRSDDLGHLWYAVPAAPMEDDTRRITGLEDGTIVLLGARRLWWSGDGERWDVVALDGEADGLAAAGGSVVVRGPTGVWEGPPDALAFTPGRVSVVGGGAARLVVTTTGLRVDGEPVDLPVDAAEVQSVHAGASGALLLGTSSGAIWRHTGAWEGCGALDTDPTHPEVAALAETPAGGLWAVTADGRLFRSEDACASWTREITPYRVDFDGGGGADDVAEAVAALVATDEAVVVAGWDGLVRGPAWAQEHLLPVDYVRGVAVGGDGAVYLGGLGGVMRSFDGGLSWDAPHRGAVDSNVQRLAVDPARPDCVWAIVNHVLHRSTNHGADWEEVATGMASVAEVWVEEVPWISGDGTLAWWDGAGWVAVADGTRHAWFDAGAACVSDEESTRCTTDRGVTWTERPEVDLLTAAGAVALREGEVLLDGEVVLEAGDDAFRNLVQADDGAWYVATRGARVWRSVDGRTWETLPLDLPSAPSVMVAVGADVLLGTYDGGFLLRDGVAEPFGRFQSVVGGSGFDVCDGCTVLADDCAWTGHLTAVTGSVSTDLRGDTVWVRGAAGDVTLSVDGEVVEGTRWSGADGWHEVRLEGDFRFEAMLASSPGATLAPADAVIADTCGEAPPAAETPGGCGGGGSDGSGGCAGARAAALLPILLGLRRRRSPC